MRQSALGVLHADVLETKESARLCFGQQFRRNLYPPVLVRHTDWPDHTWDVLDHSLMAAAVDSILFFVIPACFHARASFAPPVG